MIDISIKYKYLTHKYYSDLIAIMTSQKGVGITPARVTFRLPIACYNHLNKQMQSVVYVQKCRDRRVPTPKRHTPKRLRPKRPDRIGQTETAQTKTAQTKTAQTKTAQTKTAQTKTAQTETAQTESASPNRPVRIGQTEKSCSGGGNIHRRTRKTSRSTTISDSSAGSTPRRDQARSMMKSRHLVHGRHLGRFAVGLISRTCLTNFCGAFWIHGRTNVVVFSQFEEVLRPSGLCEFHSCTICREVSHQWRNEDGAMPGRRINGGRRRAPAMSQVFSSMQCIYSQ